MQFIYVNVKTQSYYCLNIEVILVITILNSEITERTNTEFKEMEGKK